MTGGDGQVRKPQLLVADTAATPGVTIAGDNHGLFPVIASIVVLTAESAVERKWPSS